MFRPDFIVATRIRTDVEVASKKRLLQTLAGLLAEGGPGLIADTIFERLIERERLGSTGLGHGIALPHARMRDIDQAIGAFVATAQGVDYDASDGEPVDLAFALLVPDEATDEHLQLLAQLARLFSDPRVRQRLREAESAEAVLAILTGR
jgi:PTS system nitrogen regulatory IIA component